MTTRHNEKQDKNYHVENGWKTDVKFQSIAKGHCGEEKKEDYKVHASNEGSSEALESSCLPPIRPGFKSWRRRHMWVKFIFCSLLSSEEFSTGNSGFVLSSNTFPNIILPLRGTSGHV